MSASSRSESSDEQAALARYVRDLSIPAPFDMDTFGCWLEQHRGYPIRLIPVSTRSGTLSGFLLRKAKMDYLYYEQQTSPFHQSHIVLCLAARILFGEATRPSIDPRLAPDVSPQLARLMSRNLAEDTLTPSRAEAFAFTVLNQARPAMLVRQDLRQLRPLHDALCSAVPQANSFTVPSSGFRLHRQIIGIRDAMLALRPHRDPQVASRAIAAFQAAGITGDDLTAAVEASVLVSALEANITGQPPRCADDDLSWLPVASSNLTSEIAWLAKLSQAITQLPRRDGQGHLGRTDSG